MGAADMDVIKEIPGYKVILKAVVKAQIQQLVEQLAAHTDEESVILTASVQDGTISHIGSDSGKSFLQGHEDFKSQFLGFCLKDHHRRKQQEEEEKQRKEQEQLQEQLQQQQQRQQAMLAGVQRFSPIRQSRPQPYPLTRPPGLSPRQRFSTPRAGPGPRSQGLVMPGAEKLATVKSEPKEIDETSNQSGLSAGSQSEISGNIKTDNSNDVSETGDNIPTENSQGITEQGSAKGEGNDADTEMGEVKLEALTDEDLELEITGVELGSQSSGSEVWDPNVSAGMFPDLSGAVGSSGDMQGTSQAGYTIQVGGMMISQSYLQKRHSCPACGKCFSRPAEVKRHYRIHTGEKPYKCPFCQATFNQKSAKYCHMRKKHQHFMLNENSLNESQN
ncbi:zinc finger protein with KRAB and SCAN domains 1-like isoform X5 [Mya arenaria]|uniref:zinc finger protein with KRAB and SCAN domains 1-like isoform X5 n=1 Tax=Mya arenaria TaxID=6604 RepID=UPI0022E1B571|nr:zinc finger protein with KRAB and SCAN domains 1-like isoform X5 [Mya arenaria]